MTEKKPVARRIVTVVLIVLLLLVLLTVFFCCGLPLLTGQVCYDFMSGHVPRQAIVRFLDAMFEATVAKDYDWLATVCEPHALQELIKVRSHVSAEYEIVARDSLAGVYHYRVRFDDGDMVYVVLRGEWETCPDFRVTDEEVFDCIKLTSIRLDSTDWGDSEQSEE
jgi:hypothetical protein